MKRPIHVEEVEVFPFVQSKWQPFDDWLVRHHCQEEKQVHRVKWVHNYRKPGSAGLLDIGDKALE